MKRKNCPYHKRKGIKNIRVGTSVARLWNALSGAWHSCFNQNFRAAPLGWHWASAMLGLSQSIVDRDRDSKVPHPELFFTSRFWMKKWHCLSLCSHWWVHQAPLASSIPMFRWSCLNSVGPNQNKTTWTWGRICREKGELTRMGEKRGESDSHHNALYTCVSLLRNKLN